ncbi:hypothetical protein ACWEKT_17235 [Nocardia takedensis]
MKRLLTTGLVLAAATAVATAPARAEGLALVDSPSSGSAEVVPDCFNGPMVQFNGTGSAVLDIGAELGAVVALSVYPGLPSGSGSDAAVDGPCADTDERGYVTRLLTFLHSGSAHQ